MPYRFFKQVVAISAYCLLAISVIVQANAADMNCDRQCNIDVLSNYINAVIDDRPGIAPLATNYRGTENGLTVQVGRGFWNTATGLGSVRYYFGDPVNGSAAFYGTMEEGDATLLVSLRVKVNDGKVSEAEWVLARAGEALVNFDGFTGSQPSVRLLDENEQSSRLSMISAPNAYFDALQAHDPYFVVPSVEGCPRIENGTDVTRMMGAQNDGEEAVEFGFNDCTTGLESIIQIDAVVERDYLMIDQEAGVALGRVVFHRPENGPLRQDGSPWPRLLLTEFFTIVEGKISGIYAVMHYYSAEERPGSGSGWR
ncbi:MAG: hypothetical protein COA71_03685 [SAR86 cluster bacterium]|uniref:DUF8021 domain-containing protein n=1 Tax=SAR86 cluster bacterium TaxID=2030880 RepID=A0A2A5CFU9_9GAMM|nr:MAG: hypothetical protein COA71_03685 [SAR86 cluster bacterium]